MFEAIKELLVLLWDEIKIAYIINEYEGAVLLRYGKYKRTDEAGLHWKCPFIDEVLTTNIVVTTTQPPSQSLMTKDNHNVVLSTVIKYEIKDVKPYLLEVEDSDDVLMDVTMAAVRQVIVDKNLSEINTIDKEIKYIVRKEVGKYGFKIHRVTLTDVAPMKTIRLMHDGISIGE